MVYVPVSDRLFDMKAGILLTLLQGAIGKLAGFHEGPTRGAVHPKTGRVGQGLVHGISLDSVENEAP